MSSFLKEKNAPIRKEPHVKSYSFLQIIETAVELTTISIIFFTPTDQPQSWNCKNNKQREIGRE